MAADDFDYDLDDLDQLTEELECLEGCGWRSQAPWNIDRKSGVASLAVMYFLRMLAGTRAFHTFYGEVVGPSSAPTVGGVEVLTVLGLPRPRAGMSEKQLPAFLARARTRCKQRLAKLAEREIRTPELMNSLGSFRSHLNLDDAECRVLAFASVLHHEDWFLQTCSQTFGRLDDKHGYSLVALAVGVSSKEVQKALTRGGKLAQSGLLKWDSRGKFVLDDKLECAQGLPVAFLVEGCGPAGFLAKRCRLASTAIIKLADFDYLEKEVRLLTKLLRQSLKRGSKGVNVLLYGKPGVGKTELARVLAAAVASELWEVGCEDEDGDSVEPQHRIGNFLVAQAMLRGRKDALLLFDEAEDAFPAKVSFFGFEVKRDEGSKAWINQLLENNAVPALWLSNSPDGIDAAYLRRFLYVLEVPQPPRRVRLKMLQSRGWSGSAPTNGSFPATSSARDA